MPVSTPRFDGLTRTDSAISAILPDGCVSVEQSPIVGGPLLPEEDYIVRNAVPKRRIEFAAGRWCAHKALSLLGVPLYPLLSGVNREPRWPSNVVGSITHSRHYAAAAVSKTLMNLGIDAEENVQLPTGLLSTIATSAEIAHLNNLPRGSIHWDKLLFSAKECVYKLWNPLTAQWLEFRQVTVCFQPDQGRFTVSFRAGAANDSLLNQIGIVGRYRTYRTLLLSAAFC